MDAAELNRRVAERHPDGATLAQREAIARSDALTSSMTGAGIMRDRCAFTSQDMGEGWAQAFTYAVVLGWDADPDDPEDAGVMEQLAAKFGWDDRMVEFLRDAHRRFEELPDSSYRVWPSP